MGQDIRELFKNENSQNVPKLDNGHQKRFENRLNLELPQQKQDYLWWKMAAVFIVALGTSLLFFLNGKDEQNEIQVAETPVEETEIQEQGNQFNLSDISPEYKRVEDYYMASINLEISKLNITAENKALIDSFMEQLAGLDEEYRNLNAELAETGVNEQTVEALIDNLKLRLELLFKLKEKLKELNQSEDEKNQSNII